MRDQRSSHSATHPTKSDISSFRGYYALQVRLKHTYDVIGENVTRICSFRHEGIFPAWSVLHS